MGKCLHPCDVVEDYLKIRFAGEAHHEARFGVGEGDGSEEGGFGLVEFDDALLGFDFVGGDFHVVDRDLRKALVL